MNSQKVAKIIAMACQRAFKVKVDPLISYPEPKFGDFSTNISLQLSQQLARPSQEIAQKIVEQIKDKSVEDIQIAGPGFINLTMNEQFWVDGLNKIDQRFAQQNLGKGKKVQVEFLSANPTGPLTLGNARGGYIGDVVARVLGVSGFAVTCEYYFNDAGTQINKLVESVKAAAGLVKVKEPQYSGPHIDQLAKEFKSKLAQTDDAKLKKLLTQAIFKRYIKPAVANMGIKFDVWFNESSLVADGSLESAIKLLGKHKLVFERDGATWLASGRLGDERTERVLIKSSGEPTYLATDIAYHINIFGNRRFAIAIKELGPDHIAQFPSLKAVIGRLFPDRELKMVGHQQMSLKEQGRLVKMSKRGGQYVTAQDLIDEVGPDVARFFILLRSADTHMELDLDLAREQSHQNPYYYVMYSLVRAKSILAHAKTKSMKVAPKVANLSKAEAKLARQILQLPELVSEVSQTFAVHKLTFFGIELAKLFHDYYETTKIIDLPPLEAGQKLRLLNQYILALEAYFKILGITPKERM